MGQFWQASNNITSDLCHYHWKHLQPPHRLFHRDTKVCDVSNITVPPDTAPVQGEDGNQTLIDVVSWKTCWTFGTHSLLHTAVNQKTIQVHATCILIHNLCVWWFWASSHSFQNIFKDNEIIVTPRTQTKKGTDGWSQEPAGWMKGDDNLVRKHVRQLLM